MFCYQAKYSLCNGFLKVLLIIAAKNTQNRISIVLKIKNVKNQRDPPIGLSFESFTLIMIFHSTHTAHTWWYLQTTFIQMENDSNDQSVV